MNVASQRLTDYLTHIVDAIERVRRYTVDLSKDRFLRDSLVQDAVIRNLEVVGEASHNILSRHPDFVAAHPELPFAFAYQMRNAISHGYFKVDFDIVWQTIHGDLQSFQKSVQAVLTSIPAGRGDDPPTC